VAERCLGSVESHNLVAEHGVRVDGDEPADATRAAVRDLLAARAEAVAVRILLDEERGLRKSLSENMSLAHRQLANESRTYATVVRERDAARAERDEVTARCVIMAESFDKLTDELAALRALADGVARTWIRPDSALVTLLAAVRAKQAALSALRTGWLRVNALKTFPRSPNDR